MNLKEILMEYNRHLGTYQLSDLYFSIIAVLNPNCANLIAHTYPQAEPITTTSNLFSDINTKIQMFKLLFNPLLLYLR